MKYKKLMIISAIAVLTISFYISSQINVFAYELEYQPAGTEIQFLSIENGANGTTIYTPTPTFNWTVIDNTSVYWLQIANDSAFTELVVNLTDINKYNYLSEYTANETRVSFTLPATSNLPASKTYYCNVWAFT